MGEGGASRPPCPSEDDDDVDDDGVDSGDDDRDEKDDGGVVVGDGDDDVIVGSGVGGIVGQRDGKEGGDRVADGRLTGVGNTSESSTLVVVAAGLGGAVAVVGVCGAAYCICMRRRDALKQRVPSTVSRAEPVVDPEQPRAPLSIDTSAHKRGVSQGTAQSTPYSAAASLSYVDALFCMFHVCVFACVLRVSYGLPRLARALDAEGRAPTSRPRRR